MGNKHSQGRSSGSASSSELKHGAQQSAAATTSGSSSAPHVPSPTQSQTSLRTPTTNTRANVVSPMTPSTAARINASLDHASPNTSPQSPSRRANYGRSQRRSSGSSHQMDPETAAQIVLQAAGLAGHHSTASANSHAQALSSFAEADKPRLGDGVVVGATSRPRSSSRRPASSAELLSPVATAIAASIAQNAVANSQLAPLSPRLSPATPQSPDSSRQSRSFFQRMRPRSDSVSRANQPSSRVAEGAVHIPNSPSPSHRQLAAVTGQTRSRSNSLSGTSSPANAAHSSAPLGVSELRQLQSMLNHAPSAPTPSLRTHNKREIAQSIPSSSSHSSSSHHHRSHRPASHIRIDRYTTNELMADKEQTYSPIHEPRNSTVEALGMLEDDEQLVNGVPISMTRQYSTPPIAPDSHMPPVSSYYPDPDMTVHSVESARSYDSASGGFMAASDTRKDSMSLSDNQHDGGVYNQLRANSPTNKDAVSDDSSNSSDEPTTQFKGSSHQFSYNKSEMLRNQQTGAPMNLVVKHG